MTTHELNLMPAYVTQKRENQDIIFKWIKIYILIVLVGITLFSWIQKEKKSQFAKIGLFNVQLAKVSKKVEAFNLLTAKKSEYEKIELALNNILRYRSTVNVFADLSNSMPDDLWFTKINISNYAFQSGDKVAHDQLDATLSNAGYFKVYLNNNSDNSSNGASTEDGSIEEATITLDGETYSEALLAEFYENLNDIDYLRGKKLLFANSTRNNKKRYVEFKITGTLLSQKN